MTLSHLMELHWLRIRQRIIYKVNLIVFKALNGNAPNYIQSLLSLDQPSRSFSLAAGKVNLAKNTPKQVFADFGKGRHIESESRCPAGIDEKIEIFKIASKKAAITGESLHFFIFGQFFNLMHQI